jgi:dihydropteroate synthase
MGIVNVSPDSFAGDGLADAEAAIAQGRRFVAEGADLLDVGGESTRPGAPPVPAAEELRRVLPVVEALAGAGTGPSASSGQAERLGVPIAVDTSKASVARAALAAGAWLVNDVTGFQGDPDLPGVVAQAGAGAVAMANHRQPLPRSDLTPLGMTPAGDGHESALVRSTMARWALSVERAARSGLARDRILLDPGLGFGLRPEHSLALLRRLPDLRAYGHAILVGPSRKGFIGHALGGLPVGERLEGTLAAVALAIAGGADVVRVHDVRAAHRVRLVTDAVTRG